MIDRVKAIEIILDQADSTSLVLSTTGMISREVYVTDDRPRNFYMIGSMGLLSSFGLGLAMLTPGQRVFVLDGDGSALMSLGSLPLIAAEAPGNFMHIILDNEAYESTGAQPSISSKVDLAQVAKSCGYATCVRVEDVEALKGALADSAGTPGPHLILVKAAIAPVKGIPRVTHTPAEIRDRFKSGMLTEGQAQ